MQQRTTSTQSGDLMCGMWHGFVTGIGKATATELAKQGMNVTIGEYPHTGRCPRYELTVICITIEKRQFLSLFIIQFRD